MEKRWHYFDREWEKTLLDTFGKERTQFCSLIGAVTRVGHLEVSSSPLLQKCCEQCAGKADHQAHEPKCIHPDGIVRWREWGWWSGEGTRYIGCTWVNRSLINIGEVEIGDVLWVLFKVLDGP